MAKTASPVIILGTRGLHGSGFDLDHVLTDLFYSI